MKSFLLKVLLISIPCLIFLTVVELKLRLLPNDYTFKKEHLNKNASEIKTLVLGSSLSWRGLNPIHLGENCYNAAFSGQSFKYDEFMLERYGSELTNLENVILTIFYPTYEFEKNELLSNLDKYYSVFFDFGKPALLLSIYNGSQITKQFNKIKNDPKAYIHSDSNGFRLKNSRMVGTMVKNAEKMAYYHRADSPEARAINKAHLKNIIEICKELEANVFLVIHPANKYYLEKLDPKQVDRMRSITNSMTEGNSNVQVIDLFDGEGFVQEDYFDGIHLNNSGAKKMSEIVAKQYQ